jgi:4-aminobutyrate aminotransferase / (S)-3-amino-2-methylpropionate transaminase / 5-aminovalerate transaminase
MRLNGRKVGKKKGGIISFSGNWHGRTLGAQQLSDNTKQRDWIFSPDLDIHFLPFPYPWEVSEESGREFFLESLERLESSGVNLKEDICGFMLETFQGWGAFFYPKSFVQTIREVSLNLAALMCFDEMQAGFARTGKKFGFEHYEVSPDLICCGKGMGAGLPLSGVIGRAEIMDLPEVGNMSSTHSGNPVVCAAGLAVLEEISSKELVQASLIKGQVLESLLRDLIEKFPNILRETYGHGLIRSLIFQNDNNDKSASLYASTFSELCFRRGVLVVHTGRESVKLGPPLTIPLEAIIEACAVMESVLQEL